MLKWINKKKNRKGFTLVELVVVIAILGILAALTIPKLTGFKDKAREQQALIDAKVVATAIDSLIAEDSETITDADLERYTTDLTGTIKLDEDVKTNGYFTYTIGEFTAGRNEDTNGKLEIIKVTE